MADMFSARYGDLLTGSYDCVDRIVLNAYFPLGHSPGGFRVWWRRWHDDSDATLTNAHLMRLAGRFSRRVRAFGKAHDIPVVDCSRDERKHRIAEDYLASHQVGVGMFLILVARAPATVWEVRRSAAGVIRNLEKRKAFVNHYSFHIMDPIWGHLTIKMSGHPPFGAQVILNGHEYVACTAQSAGIGFAKEGNCFTRVADPDPAGLAGIADTLSRAETIGRLSQVIDRWIYTACLCFGLDRTEQARSGFGYSYSIYQVEYSRNLLFAVGGDMDRVFNAMADRTRSRLDVPKLRTLFGTKQRPRQRGADLSPRQAVVIERPRWDLSIFKVHFGLLTLKGYTKGEHVLRFEAIVHNTRALGCGRMLDKFGKIVARLAGMVDRFTTMLDCVNISFLPDRTLDQLERTRLSGHLHSHYRSFTATMRRSAGEHGNGTQLLTVSAARSAPYRPVKPPRNSIRARLPKFPAKAAGKGHAASVPDTAWPIHGHPPDSSQIHSNNLVLMSLRYSRHVNSGRLPHPHHLAG